MVQITTTSQTDPISWPNSPSIARVMGGSLTGNLFALVRTGTDTLTLYRSTDSGGSWSTNSNFTHTGIQEWSGLVVDHNGYGHLAYRVGTGSADTIWYRRVNLTSGSWSSGLQTSLTDANGGVIGSAWQGVDLALVRRSTGDTYIAVCGARTEGSTRYGMIIMGVYISTGGTISLNNTILLSNRYFFTNGVAPGRSGVSAEIAHTGNGFTSSSNSLWVTWGRTTRYSVKLGWNGGSWTGPSTFTTIRSGLSAHDAAAGRYDGSRWLMPVISPDNTSQVRVYQRNSSNTSTTYVETPTHPTGVIRQTAVSYDGTSKNLRVYAVGTSTTVLYYVDYVRNTATWSSWATVTATAVLGAAGAEWTVRRGGSSGNSRHDVLTAHSGAPNTVVHTAQGGSSTPNVATWITSGQPYTNGGPADVAAALTLDWEFTDPDAADTQGFYAVQRQIGAGALQYWRASDSTWQATEQQNASASTQLTLAAAWAGASDANYTYKVKVWDSAGTPASGYSDPLVIIPSAKVNPAIVSPTAAQVLNTNAVTMTWTAAEQKQRRVRLLTNPGGVVAHDSGFQATSDLSYTVPVELANGTGWTIELTTTNNEDLPSTAQSRNFTVVYSPPAAGISTLLPVPLSGIIRVTHTANAPVGAQPAIAGQDLYRRKRIAANLTGNPSMAGNVTGWSGAGTTSMVYSTAQFRDSPGSALATPTGAAADSQVVLTTPVVQTTQIAAGARYTARGWIRPTTANKSVRIQVNWYDSVGALLGNTGVTVPSPVAGAWLYVQVEGADPAAVSGAARVGMAIGLTGTPAAGDTFYADLLELLADDLRPGTRVATGLGSGAVHDDWGAEGAFEQEYRWVTTGASGASITGPWTV